MGIVLRLLHLDADQSRMTERVEQLHSSFDLVRRQRNSFAGSNPKRKMGDVHRSIDAEGHQDASMGGLPLRYSSACSARITTKQNRAGVFQILEKSSKLFEMNYAKLYGDNSSKNGRRL
ncbi:hypothetical protein CDAR_494321 [Caerostris darwini]|uniref:Uncharacterized protein n=1 Tax=Caerostris darwini TaxID=1538125 RepID=A0AAV4TN70_9ARAC|nr:hypothetical protein CDAR_494321 [Caerostris darwini]